MSLWPSVRGVAHLGMHYMQVRVQRQGWHMHLLAWGVLVTRGQLSHESVHVLRLVTSEPTGDNVDFL